MDQGTDIYEFVQFCADQNKNADLVNLELLDLGGVVHSIF